MFAQTIGKRARVTGFARADGLHGTFVTVMRVVGEQCSPLRYGLYQSLKCVIENVCQYHLTLRHSLDAVRRGRRTLQFSQKFLRAKR